LKDGKPWVTHNFEKYNKRDIKKRRLGVESYEGEVKLRGEKE